MKIFFHSIEPTNQFIWNRLTKSMDRCTGGAKHRTSHKSWNTHDDVIRWKHFPRYWPFVRGIHRWPVNSPHLGQWRGALMFSLVYAWINGWVNNRGAGDLRRHRVHYDVMVMLLQNIIVGDANNFGGKEKNTTASIYHSMYMPNIFSSFCGSQNSHINIFFQFKTD